MKEGACCFCQEEICEIERYDVSEMAAPLKKRGGIDLRDVVRRNMPEPSML